MKRRFYIVAFHSEKDSDLLLTAVVPVDDVDKREFSYTQEIAIDGVAYDAEIYGYKAPNGVCEFNKVKIYRFNKSTLINTCEVVASIPHDFTVTNK